MYDDDQVTSPGLSPSQPTLVGPRPFNKDHTMIGIGDTGYALAQMRDAQAALDWDDEPTGILPLAPSASDAPPAMKADELLDDEEAENALAQRLAAEPNLPKVRVQRDADEEGERLAVTRKMPRVMVAREPGAAATPVPVVSSAPPVARRVSEAELSELGVLPRRRSWFGGVAVAAAVAITAGIFALSSSSGAPETPAAATDAAPADDAPLQTISQGVRLSASQPGVRLSIDGKDHGLLPAKVELEPGAHVLRLEGGDGLVPVERQITVTDGTMLDLGSVELPAAGRSLAIAGVPHGARVALVDLSNPGEPRVLEGPFPRSVELPEEGDYKLVTTLPGHHHFVRRLAWADGESELSIEVDLVEKTGAPSAATASAEPTPVEEEIDDPYADEELDEGAGPTNAPPADDA